MSTKEKIRKLAYRVGVKAATLPYAKGSWKYEYAALRWWFVCSDHYQTRFKPEFDEKLAQYRGEGCPKSWRTRLDYWLCWIFLGAEPEDYFDYEFFKKGWLWRNHHITRQRLNFMDAMLNEKEQMPCTALKSEFYRHWNDWLCRPWCAPREVSYEQFESLFGSLNEIMVKPVGSFGGKGIYVIDLRTADLRKVYDELHNAEEETVAEAFVHQKGFLNDIYPAALNPLRVTTLRMQDEVTVLYSFFTAGCNGTAIANDCSGGICFSVDTQSGKLGPGQGRASNNHICHPDTGVKVAGEYVPAWERIKAFACEAHKHAPEGLGLIGWDVCLSGDDISLVEGNCGPGFPELPDRRDNMWKAMQGYLNRVDEIKRQKRDEASAAAIKV